MLMTVLERRLVLLTIAALASVAAGVANVGCTTILGSSGSRYRWAMQNPALVAPVLLDYDVQEYRSPLMASLADGALVVSAPADITANFNLTYVSSNGTDAPQKYILQSIFLRKPAIVAEGTKQELSHELEVVLVHREVTGTGYFANIVVPVEVSAEPGLDLLAPLVNQADLPTEVGETQPVLVTNLLPLKLQHVYQGVSFQHFWGEITTSCNQSTAGARVLMRNATMATSKPVLEKILKSLEWTPSVVPVIPPAQTWMVQPCPRGGTCSLPAATDLTSQLTEASQVLKQDTSKLEEAKKAMDGSLLGLTSNISNVSNDAYTLAIRRRDDLRNAEAAVDGASRTVSTLQEQINSAKAAVWDSNAPAQTSPSVSSTTVASRSNQTTTTTTTTSSISPAVAATPSFLEGSVHLQACNDGAASPLEVDLAQVEHVDATAAGAAEALLFWRLSATPSRPADAAAAETAAEAPRLRMANLGDRLRISGDKPIMVLLVHGKELPISFADISVPGEHSISGRRADAEIQLVHLPADPTQALAVALLMDDGGDASNVWLQHMAALPRAGEVAQVQGSDPMSMHPAFSRGVAGHYYRYSGRLQKSKCAHVRWNILEERGHISTQQLLELRQVLQPPASVDSFSDPSALLPMVLPRHKVSLASVRQSTQTVPASAVAAGNQVSSGSEPAPNLKSLLLSLPRTNRLRFDLQIGLGSTAEKTTRPMEGPKTDRRGHVW
ncbi:hypothetical protein AK812_SmicGene25283 [Symbiodinium microadriaticum]|uniref:carbonic anhydrase n=1 Tax=Symbiodinium microadriaticum TaxID=2951 RepID=A0A1Q9DC85_SYMMI|nr:hypothetical protein AK812_SmicGene25283 [Symbiodinium microadriaticum]